MATYKLGTVVKHIKDIEGFDVVVQTTDGNKVRIDKEGFHAYDFENKAKGTCTVSHWRDTRFKKKLAGYECIVLDGSGAATSGQTTLEKLRSTY
jgi:hypothetical protein